MKRFDAWLLVTFGFICGVSVAFAAWSLTLTAKNYPIDKKDPKECQPTFVDNGLSDWASDTNHAYGPAMAKKIHIQKTGWREFHITAQDTNGVWTSFFQKDIAYSSQHEAQRALKINMSLMVDKAFSDAIEDAFKK